VDITELMEKYKSLRSSIQKTFDDGTSLFGSHQTSAAVAAMAPSLLKSAPSMPALPRSSFGLGNDTRTTSSQLHASGFTPKLDYAGTEPPSSSFTRPNMARTSEQPISSGTETVSSGNASSSGMVTSAVLATPLGFRTTVLSPSNDDAGSTGFTPENSFNGHDAIKRKDVSSSPFNFKPSTPAVPLTPGFSSFLGSSKPSDNLEDSSTPHPHSKSTSSNPSPPSPSGFGFGTGKNSSTSKPLSFGKGSIGNPVGFAFGSPAATPDEVKPPDTSDTSQDTGLKGGSEATDGALLSTSSHDPSPAPSQGSTYDADGPGEEDEITLHEIKAHAYKMVSTGDAKNWVSAGKGKDVTITQCPDKLIYLPRSIETEEARWHKTTTANEEL
jgi:nucleoporin NUP2